MLIERSPLMQVAFTVENLDEAIEHWARSMRVGPFFTLLHPQYVRSHYRGQETTLDISLAFAFSGDMQIELVQVHDDQPSVFREQIQRSGYGLHHLGKVCDDLLGESEQMIASGAHPVQHLHAASGTETLFLEGPGCGNSTIELIKGTDRLRDRFAVMKAAADSWDGRTFLAT